MGERTAISWTDATWNPVTGCSHVSEGCRNCYAEALSLRMGWSKKPWTAANARQNVVLHPDRLRQPLNWKKPRMVFVNSMSDLFHKQVPDRFIHSVFDVMAGCLDHIFQILTKRPQRMKEFMTAWSTGYGSYVQHPFVLSNVWLGVSVENQCTADERIPLLLQTPAAVRFLSCEPLLESLDIECYLDGAWSNDDAQPYPNVPAVDWVIIGGESGPNFRPMDLDWARSIRDQCLATGVPFFYKQGSGRYPGKNDKLDGVEWKQFPRRHEIPKHIIVITTRDKSVQQIVEEMMAVPMDKHMLLDIFIGYQRGDYRKFSEEQLDLKRLQQLLNSEYRGKRFNFLGSDEIAQMVRHSIATEGWNPFKEKGEKG